MTREILQLAGDGKFSEFEAAVKAELKTKMGNHEEIKTYTSAFDKIQDMKNLFKQINTPSTPTVPAVETPKVDEVPAQTSNTETAPADIKEENLKTDGE